jgi:uroporphyrinogen decarboxylase
MNSRQRVLTALSCRQPDRVPVMDHIDLPVLQGLAGLLGVEPGDPEREFAHEDLLCGVADALGLDAVLSITSRGTEPVDSRHIRDRYGCTYLLSEHGEPVVTEGPVRSAADLRGLDMAARVQEKDFAGPRRMRETIHRDTAIFLMLDDPFVVSWTLRGGMEALLLDFAMTPDLVHALARIGTDYGLAVMETAARLNLCDGIFLGGDLADEQITLMSPKHYRAYIKPYEKELVDQAHRLGLKIIKHSDGNLWLILDDLLELGFDGIHPIQPQCMDLAEVKKHIAGKACALGNIDCRHVLVDGTEDEVVQAVKTAISQAASGGGYILGSSNTIHPACRPENVIAMVRAAHEYGHYPNSA